MNSSQKKMNKTYFIYSIRSLDSYGKEVEVDEEFIEKFEKTVKGEVEACACFSDYQVKHVMDFSKEKNNLPQDASVVYYEITYTLTTAKLLRYVMNFFFVYSLGIIPTGYGWNITTDITLFEKQRMMKKQRFESYGTEVAELFFLFALPFKEATSFPLTSLTNNFIVTSSGENLIPLVK
ncbi:hypothetical protein [Leptospira stimsonii]|nr:hypothetical protein [Leptospira stimsonii]